MANKTTITSTSSPTNVSGLAKGVTRNADGTTSYSGAGGTITMNTATGKTISSNLNSKTNVPSTQSGVQGSATSPVSGTSGISVSDTRKIPVGTIATTTQKPTILNTQDQTMAQAGMSASSSANSTIENLKNKLQEEINQNLDPYKLAMEQYGQERLGKATELQQMEDSAGMTQRRQQLSNVLNQLDALTSSYQAGLVNVEGKPIPMEFITGQQAEMSKQYAVQSNMLTAQASMLDRNIQGMEDSITKAVDAKYSDLEARYQNAKDMYELNKDLMTPQQQELAKLKTFDAEQAMADIQDFKDFKTDLLKQAMANEAPTGVKNNIMNASDYQSAVSAAGKYGGDYLKNQLLKAQIESEKASAAKTYFEMKQGKPASQAQYTAAGFANRVVQSKDIIDKNISSLSNLKTAEYLAQRKLPNFMQSSLMQSELQAERNFVNAVLRRESGAAISPEEFTSAEKQYFPMPGDSAQVLAQKKANRDLTSQNLINESGSAYTPQTEISSSNMFSKALGIGNISIPGTSIINNVGNDGSINFNLPK